MPATAPLPHLPELPDLPPPPSASALYVSAGTQRCPFVFDRFQHAVTASSGRAGTWPLRLARVDASTRGDLKTALDACIGGAALVIADITPGSSGDDTPGNATATYAVGRAHQADVPVFLICDRRFAPKPRQPAPPWAIDAANIHWYHFSPQGLDVLVHELTARMASASVAQRVKALFPAARAKRPSKRAPRRATDLSAQMTLGNHTLVGRVTSLSSSGAFFVPRAFPGERLSHAQPARLSLVHGRKSEQRDIELRRVGPAGSPNVLGFGVRFVRPSGARRGPGPTPNARG